MARRPQDRPSLSCPQWCLPLGSGVPVGMQTVLLKAKTDRGEGDLSLREAPLSDAEEGSRWGGACLGPTAHLWLRFLAHGC